MFGKNFGEKKMDEQRQAELLYPANYAPAGHAGVYIKHYVTGGNVITHEDDEFGPRTRIVTQPTRSNADVIVADENFSQIGTRTIRQGRFTSDERFKAKVFRAIEKAFADAGSYADAAGVPVDLNGTHADIHLAWER